MIGCFRWPRSRHQRYQVTEWLLSFLRGVENTPEARKEGAMNTVPIHALLGRAGAFLSLQSSPPCAKPPGSLFGLRSASPSTARR